MLPIHRFDGALEAAEESFGADESGLEVDRVGELVDCVVVSKIFSLPNSDSSDPALLAENLLYFKTSSKCFKCSMMTSRCFSKIASAMNKWKLLLR